MKVFVIVATFVWITAVSGDATSISHDLLGIYEDMDNMPEQFQCFANSMKHASIANGIEEDWSVTLLAQIQFHIDNWKECVNAGNEIDIVRCSTKAMTTAQYYLTEYILTLNGIKKTKALLDYMREIRAKCGLPELSEEMETLFDNVSNSPRCFICLANSIGETWTYYGMDEIWKQYYPQLRVHFDKWEKCAKIGNQEDVKSCNTEESHATYSILNECIALMGSMNPKVSIDFGLMAQERCNQCRK